MKSILQMKVHNHVGYIILNRPEVYNALNTALMKQLKEALEKMNEDRDVSCIVLSGAGESFSTGADIKEFSAQTSNNEQIQERAQLTMDIHRMMSTLSKPIIASVKKYVFAGGCGIALACDLVLAASNSQFSYPEIRRGFVPALVTPNLARTIDRKKAFELLITGERINAEEALSYGMINHIYPVEELEEKTVEFAEKIAAYSPIALEMTKTIFYSTLDLPLDKALDEAREYNVKMRKTEHFKKGVQDFMNRK